MSRPSFSARQRSIGSLAKLLAGNGTFMASQWVLLVVIIRAGGASDAGRYVLATTISSPFFLFGSVKLRQAFVADPDGPGRYAVYRRVRLVSTIAAATAALVVGGLWMDPSAWWILGSVVSAKVAEALCDLHYAVMQRERSFGAFGLSLGLRGVLGVGSAGLALALEAPTDVALVAWSLSWWLTLLLRDRKYTVPTPTAVPWFAWLELGRRLAPLGVAAFAAALSTSIPRLMIEREMGLADLGAFGAILMLYTAVLFGLETATDVLVGPMAAAHRRAEADALRHLLQRTFAFGAAVSTLGVVLAMTFGGKLLRVLYGTDLGADNQVAALTVLCGALGLHIVAAVCRTGVLVSGQFAVRLRTEVLAMMVGFATALVLVPRYGLVGASWSMALTAVVQSSISVVHAQRHLGVHGRDETRVRPDDLRPL